MDEESVEYIIDDEEEDIQEGVELKGRDRKFNPILKPYLKSKIIIERTKQLHNGDLPMIDTTGLYAAEDVATKEFIAGVLPFKVKIVYPNGDYEYVKINEFRNRR